MRLKTKDFKNACKTILYALDTKNKTLYSKTLELKTIGSTLNLIVSNGSYYVTVKFDLGYEENFKAAVNAQLFLTLVSKITTDEVEIVCEDRNIKIVANGEYKLPMIYNNNVLLELPPIEIGNQTGSMYINSDTLLSINLFNSKELQRGIAVKPVQNYYYVDEFGAITFTSGACVNSFTLEKPIKLLLFESVVRLFKLFNKDENILFTIGQDELSDTLVETKVVFENSTVTIATKLPDMGMISMVPVDAIRNMANGTYSYSVVVEKNLLLDSINRILLFHNNNTYGKFEFTESSMTIYDYNKDNWETINFINRCDNLNNYSLVTDLANFALILEGVEDEYISINFGDHKAIVVRKNNIVDIIPEIKVN